MLLVEYQMVVVLGTQLLTINISAWAEGPKWLISMFADDTKLGDGRGECKEASRAYRQSK